MIVSLEQAYHIFLRSKQSSDENDLLTIAEYMVYSQFMRFGCNIQKFREDKFQSPIDSEDNDTPTHTPSENESQAPDNLIDPTNETIPTIEEQTHECKSQCNTSETTTHTSNSVKRKRSMDHDSNTQFSRKSAKTHHDSIQDDQYYGSGTISDFMVGDEFEKFKEIFDKINVIQLKAAATYDHDIHTELRFSFDFWITKDNVKQLSTGGPNFRIIIQYVYLCSEIFIISTHNAW